MSKIDQDLLARLKPIIESQKFLAHLGVEITELGAGFGEIAMDFDEHWSAQNGCFDGGIVGTLADHSAGLVGGATLPKGSNSLTAEYKLNILAPAKGDRLIARAKVIKSGRTLVVAESNVYSQTGTEERHVATALVTLVAV